MVGRITVNLVGLPEIVCAAHKAIADILRKEADSERNPAVAKRLRELANDFEIGGSL